MIDSNTLLQTDATVIAGVLILITIYSLKPTVVRRLEEAYQELSQSDEGTLWKAKNEVANKLNQALQEEGIRKKFALVIVFALVPFSSSAFLVILDEALLRVDAVLTVAAILAGIGFLYLIIAVVIIIRLPFIKQRL